MRIIQSPLRPFDHLVKDINQEKLVNRLFLHSESIRKIFYCIDPNDGLVYLDLLMGPSDNLGNWHEYYRCFRFEWLRSLDEVAGLYRGASEAYERMWRDIEEQMQRAFEREDELSLIHDWRKDGF
jgi:hypothetical protein